MIQREKDDEREEKCMCVCLRETTRERESEREKEGERTGANEKTRARVSEKEKWRETACASASDRGGPARSCLFWQTRPGHFSRTFCIEKTCATRAPQSKTLLQMRPVH